MIFPYRLPEDGDESLLSTLFRNFGARSHVDSLLLVLVLDLGLVRVFVRVLAFLDHDKARRIVGRPVLLFAGVATARDSLARVICSQRVLSRLSGVAVRAVAGGHVDF